MTKGDSDEFYEELNKVLVHNDVHFQTRARVDRLFEAGVASAYDPSGRHVWTNPDAWLEYYRLEDKLTRLDFFHRVERDIIAKRMNKIFTDNTEYVDEDSHHICTCRYDEERTNFPVLRIEGSEFDGRVTYRHFEAYHPDATTTMYPYYEEQIVDEWVDFNVPAASYTDPEGDPE